MRLTLGDAPGPVAVLRGHNDAVVSLKYACLQHLYSGAANGVLLKWNLNTLRPDINIQAHAKSIISINDIDESTLVTSSRDSTIKIWDSNVFDTPKAVLRFGHDHFCNSCISFVNGSPLLVTPGIEQSQIFVWDLRNSQPVQILSAEDTVGMITSLCVAKNIGVKATSTDSGVEGSEQNNDQNFLFGGFEDGSIHAFDLRTNRTLCHHKVHSEPVFALDASISSSGVAVVSGGGDNLLVRSSLDLETRLLPWALSVTDTVSLKHPGTSCIKHRQDGRIVVSAHWDHTLRVYDKKRLKPLGVFKHHRDSVYAVEFLSTHSTLDSHEGKNSTENALDGQQPGGITSPGYFATGSKDHTIAIWSLFADSCQ